MKISYAITVCNETIEIQRLLGFLLQHKRDQDEIVVLFDSKNGTSEVREILKHYAQLQWYSWHEADFQGHFADWKNYLTKLCTGDYIFQIDADELVDEYICRLLPQILETNQVDVIRVPRINTVKGLTEKHIQQWGWNVNEKGWVNFPDYQWRIYRNVDSIKWQNKVHETLIGYKTISHLPTDAEFCLIHDKTIERQERQNNYYDTL
jgi:hypothetical protein